MAASRGTLFLVVGPSGAGKDTLIDGAKAALLGDGRFVFPTREITRPNEAGGEDHREVTVAAFEQKVTAGDYAFHWGAHGLFYGIPVSVLDDLDNGRSVVVNVSRSIVDEARAQVSPLRILSITVDDSVLRRRLEDRGREEADDIEARIERASRYTVHGDDVVCIDNAGPVTEGVQAMVAALLDAENA